MARITNFSVPLSIVIDIVGFLSHRIDAENFDFDGKGTGVDFRRSSGDRAFEVIAAD